jgi:hypothetical protein
MPKQSNKGSEHSRVWEVKDYGNIDALVRMAAGISGSGVATDASGRTLFPEGMPTGVSTIVENGKVAPTAGVKSAAQDVLNDPQAFVDKNVNPEVAADESLFDKGKSFLSTIFNTEDTWKDGKYQGADNPVESVWDSFLTGVNWGYDRIPQATVAALSALPGGTQTLDWDQAGEVSFGQQVIANIGVSAGDVKRGEGNIGDIFSLSTFGPLGLVGLAAPEERTQKKGFDITSEQDRKVFEDGWEKFGSGSLDTAFTIFADPLIVGGKLLKVARIKYIDRPVNEKTIVQMTKELADGAALHAAGNTERMNPISKFANDAITPGADGSRMPVREIMAREEISWSSNAEGIADALRTIPDNDYGLASVVIRAGLGERTAVDELILRSARASDTLANANSQALMMRFLQNPGVEYVNATARLTRTTDALFKNLEMMKKGLAEGTATSAQVRTAQREFDRAIDDLNNIKEMKLRDHLDPPPGQDALAVMEKMVEEARDTNQWFAKALAVAEQSPLTEANKGFATDTVVGRFVSKRRAKRARKDYERVSTSGQGIRSQDFFGTNRFQRTIRVWSRASDWTPSWYVDFANPTDQGREIGAVLDSLSYLSSAPRKVKDAVTGEMRDVGGIARKDELFQMYTTSRSLGDEVSATMLRIEDSIKDDLVDFYGFDRKLADELRDKAMEKMGKTKEDITRNPKGFFLSDDSTSLSSLNVAPFLNTQLNNGMYILPWDHFETVLKNIESGKIKDWEAGNLTTKTGWTVEKAIIANDIFQDFWRPAVLFRLGYTQRNVTEGLFRGVAFSGSLDPVVSAGKAFLNVKSNYRRAKRADRETAKARALLEAGDEARDRFDGLAAAQIDLFDESAWLRTAKGRLGAQEQLIAEATDVPVRSFSGDPASGLLLSDDGAFQLQRVMEEVAAPAAAQGIDRSRGLMLDEQGVLTKFYSPTVFKKAEGTGVWVSDDGVFEVTQAGKGKWLRTQKSELGGVGPSQRQFSTKKEAMSGSRAATDEEIQSLTSTSMEEVAREWRGLDQLRNAPMERWRINQLDPVDNATFIPGTGKTFETAEEATRVLNDVIADVYAGRKQAFGPQLELVAQRAAKGRTTAVKPEMSPSGKEFKTAKEAQSEIDRIEAELATIKREIDTIGGRPIPARLKGSKFQKWREKRMESMEEEVLQSIAFEENMQRLLKAGEVVMDDTIERNLMLVRQGREMLETRLKYLETDDMYALSEYTNQSAARRVVDNGSKVYVGGVMIESAFGDPKMREINWKNLSSDNTIKATIALRSQTADSIIYKIGQKQYVDVLPGQKGYWEGMESMLRQYSQSPMGQMILKGDSDETIATWLLTDPKGMKLRDDLDNAWKAAEENAELKADRIGDNLDNAINFATTVRKGLEQITAGNKNVWKVMQAHPPSADELKAMMKDMPELSPVVGDTTELLGFKKVMDSYRTFTQAAFRQIGTKPEDAFVRGPFYARRYTETRDTLVRNLLSQYKNVEEIPIERINWIEKAAHTRALKDTKDFLYTIDRKTNLGKYAETMFPFISAAQNSLTAFGRLTYRDPSVVGAIALLWQAPTKAGWEDKDGNIIIPIPHALIPDGVEDFFGIRGMKNATINKSSLNVIMPESGFAFVPRPTPLIQAASSQLMKNGLFGQYSVEAPPILTGLFGDENAEGMWKYFKNYMYGEEGGISQEMLSYEKLLPPAWNKAIQYLQKDGSSQYGYQYALQARTQDLLWRAGAREDYPTSEEIMNRTNGMFLLRMAGNLLAFTPPNYQSPIQPLIDIQRAYDEKYGLEGPMKFSENFGNEMLILSSTDSTRNVGGTTTSVGTVRNIKNYDGLVREVAGAVSNEDLDVLGILVNEDLANSEYDINAYRWMQQENIPGTTRKWRETNSGGESMAESQRQAGWVEYIKFKGQIDALLQQRGLTSYSAKGAQDLNAYRKEFESNMMSNPMYEGWANDFKSTGSSKTYSAVKTITAALNDDKFMADHAESRTWQIAAEYIDTRERLIQMVKESGVTLENQANAALKEQWETYRQGLINMDMGWAGISNRYLRSDDNPVPIGASFSTGGM